MGGSPFGGPNDLMFQIFPVVFVIIFVFAIGFFIAFFVSAAKRWRKDSKSPVLTVDAKVAAKRANVGYAGNHHDAGAADISRSSSSTSYFATFEVASGDRMEFQVHDNEFGMLAENDIGKLTFQGSRFLGFERFKGASRL
jgi:hypothetical protein